MTAASAYLPAVLTLCAALMTTAETGVRRASGGADNDNEDWDRKVLVAVDEFETLVRAAVAAKNNGQLLRRGTAFGNGDLGETDAVAAVVPPPVPIDGPVAVSAARYIVRRVMENIKKMHRKGGSVPVLTVHYRQPPQR